MKKVSRGLDNAPVQESILVLCQGRVVAKAIGGCWVLVDTKKLQFLPKRGNALCKGFWVAVNECG